MIRPRLILSASLLGLCSLLIGGCLSGEVRSHVRYDKAADSFTCLQYFSNIQTLNSTEQKHLQGVWDRRESIIVVPFIFDIFRAHVVQRLTKNSFRWVDVGDPAAEAAKVIHVQVDLDSIKVIPGEFFLDSEGSLGCYQQCVVPGKTVDAVLEEISPGANSLLTSWAQRQLRNRDGKEEPQFNWNVLRLEIVKVICNGQDPKDERTEKEKLHEPRPLETESLKALVEAASKQQIRITRIGDVVTIVLPFTKHDAEEAESALELARDIIAAQIKAGKRPWPAFEKIADAITLRYFNGTGLEISVQFPKLANAVLNDGTVAPEKIHSPPDKETISYLEKQGIEINKKFSMKSLLEEHDSNKHP